MPERHLDESHGLDHCAAYGVERRWNPRRPTSAFRHDTCNTPKSRSAAVPYYGMHAGLNVGDQFDPPSTGAPLEMAKGEFRGASNFTTANWAYPSSRFCFHYRQPTPRRRRRPRQRRTRWRPIPANASSSPLRSRRLRRSWRPRLQSRLKARRHVVPPAGAPAGAETSAGVVATLREVFACANAGDPLRVASLYTDDFLRDFFGAVPREDLLDFLATPPQPLPEDQKRIIVRIRERSSAYPMAGRG